MHPNHHPIIPSSRYETEVALASRSLREEKKRHMVRSFAFFCAFAEFELKRKTGRAESHVPFAETLGPILSVLVVVVGV